MSIELAFPDLSGTARHQPDSYRTDYKDPLGEDTVLNDQIHQRLALDPKEAPLTGVIVDWSFVVHRPGVGVIYGTCVEDNTARRFAGHPLRTSMVIKIEDGFAVTLNSVYRLVPERRTPNPKD